MDKKELDCFQTEEAGKTEALQHCMERVFAMWKSAMTSDYTWQNLVSVLVSNDVKEKAAAMELYKSLAVLKKAGT